MADGWTALAHSTSQLPALGMGMIGLRERNEDRDLALGIAKERLGMQEETAKQTALYHQAQLAQKPPLPKDQQPMDPTIVDMSKAAATNKWGPNITKIMDPYLEKIKSVAASSPSSTFGDAFSAASSFYPEENERMIAEGSKLLASGKLAGTAEEKKLSEFINFLHYDKENQDFLKNGVFKNTYEAIRQREANSPAAIEALKQEGKPDKGEWSEPFQMGGAWVQKNNVTGQIHQAVGRAPVGEGDTAKLKKMDDKARQIEKDAAAEAKRQTLLKFNIQPSFTTDSEGKVQIAWPANKPEVFQYYQDTQAKITTEKTRAAVKRGLLSKDYLPEAPVAGGVLPTETPAPEQRKLVPDGKGGYVYK